MPSKNRRLPGGKVRKLPARPRTAVSPTEPAGAPADPRGAVAPPPSEANGTPPPAGMSVQARPAVNGGRPLGGLIVPEGVSINLAPPARALGAAGTPGTPGALEGAVPRRRGAVVARSAVRRPAAASLDLAEASLTHIRRDLLRIAILSAVMIGVIVGIAVVLR